MYKVTFNVILKEDITIAHAYEKLAIAVRLFIKNNDGKLMERHYEKEFSFYSFSNMSPYENDQVYKKGNVYTVELRSLHKEFLDIKKHIPIETDSLVIISATCGKLYYKSQGEIQTEAPLFMSFLNKKRLETKEEEEKLKVLLRENMIYRYLKSGDKKDIDLDFLRENVVDRIVLQQHPVVIPFSTKPLNNGDPLKYHCRKAVIKFKDTDIAKEVEKVIYAGGIGHGTSNGFGFIR